MSELYLSQIRLRRGTGDSPEFWRQVGLLHDPHRLVWSFFPMLQGTARDFLFRQDGEGERQVLHVLSPRRPSATERLWEVKTAPFAPKLRAGERLEFMLRANAVQRVVNVARRLPDLQADRAAELQARLQSRIERRSREREAGARRVPGSDEKHDVVMLLKLAQAQGPPELRRSEPDLVREAGLVWLRRQGQGDDKGTPGAGFDFDEQQVQIDGYRQHRLARRAEGGRKPDYMTFSTLELAGVLTVINPTRMVERLWAGSQPGLGSARGFGCGLMLVRRARMVETEGDDE